MHAGESRWADFCGESDIQSLLVDHDWICFFCNSLDTIMIIIWFQLWVRLLYTPSPELRPQGSMLAEFTSAPRATPSTCLGDSRSYLIHFLCVL